MVMQSWRSSSGATMRINIRPAQNAAIILPSGPISRTWRQARPAGSGRFRRQFKVSNRQARALVMNSAGRLRAMHATDIIPVGRPGDPPIDTISRPPWQSMRPRLSPPVPRPHRLSQRRNRWLQGWKRPGTRRAALEPPLSRPRPTPSQLACCLQSLPCRQQGKAGAG